MPVMFCYIDPFIMSQQVVEITPDNNTVIFKGSLEAACEYMANQYESKEYDRIVLKGGLADSAAEMIREYAITKYSAKNIKIEVLK